MKRHQAGRDLTEDITAAPHDHKVLERFPQVGVLAPGKDPMDEGVPDFLLALCRRFPMLRRHPHPMTVHFPIAFMVLVPILNFLYLATGDGCIEKSALYVLVAGLFAAPVAMVTGPYNWWLNYGGRWTRTIGIKIGASLLLLVLILTAFLWRMMQPDIMMAAGGARVVYLGLTLALPAVVIVLGWFGAKMTFPH
jgi:uncharacterized membrane protein